jgi:hypothetical protein
MRGLVCLIVGTGMMLAASSASAQRYDPAYPVCMELNDDNGTRMECMFTTMEQCKEGAKSMPGSCFNNPYYKPSAAPAAEAAPEPTPSPSPAPVKKKKKG